MHRVSTKLFILAMLMSASITGCSSSRVLDPAYGQRLARREKRPLLYYFRKWDSPHHRNMCNNVLGDKTVKKALKDVVVVELEYAWSGAYRSRYGVRHPQVCVLCDPNGEQAYMPMYVNPVPEPDAFLTWLNTAKEAAQKNMGTDNQG